MSAMSVVMEVGWEDPRDFVDDGGEVGGLVCNIATSFRSVTARVRKLEEAELMETTSDNESEASTSDTEFEAFTSGAELEQPRVDVRLGEPRVDAKFVKHRDDAKPTKSYSRDTYEAALIFDEADDLSDEEGRPRSSFLRQQTRRFRGGGDRIRFQNSSNTSVFIMCTQDFLTVLKSGGAGVNASPSGVEVKVDVANELVRTKEIKTTLKIGSKESQDVWTVSKYVMVSAFAIRGDTMTLMYSDVLLKKGHKFIVEQRDIENAMTEREVEQLELFAA